MNQFWDYHDIYGKAETAHLERTLEELCELVAAVRKQLGEKRYLMDNYLSYLLQGANAVLLYNAVESGFNLTSELHHLCQSVMKGKSDCTDHPLYDRVKEYIETHPLSYLEAPTKVNLYCIALMDSFLEYAAEKADKKQRECVRPAFDIVELRDLYRQITAMIGREEKMERINLLFRQRFLIVTPMAGFMQGMTNDLLYLLTERDPQTNQLAVSLWLNEQDR